MVGKYVHRSIQIAASQTIDGPEEQRNQSQQNTLDAGGQAVGGEQDNNDTLLRLIRREVRRALVEEGVAT